MNPVILLADLDGLPGTEETLVTALALGKKFDARVQLLHVEMDPMRAAPILGDGMTGMAVEQLIESLEARGIERRNVVHELYKKHCIEAGLKIVEPDSNGAAEGFEVSFESKVGREAEEIETHGRLADLVIVNRPDRDNETDSSAIDAALFGTGKPALFVPSGFEGGCGEAVMIAWDGSRESARAVSAALPFLKQAERVFIASGREDKDVAPPSRLLGFLKAHGVKAETWAFNLSGEGISADLLRQASKASADMLVMGAYGHSRFRELVLGGATRGVLKNAKISGSHDPLEK